MCNEEGWICAINAMQSIREGSESLMSNEFWYQQCLQQIDLYKTPARIACLVAQECLPAFSEWRSVRLWMEAEMEDEIHGQWSIDSKTRKELTPSIPLTGKADHHLHPHNWIHFLSFPPVLPHIYIKGLYAGLVPQIPADVYIMCMDTFSDQSRSEKVLSKDISGNSWSQKEV